MKRFENMLFLQMMKAKSVQTEVSDNAPLFHTNKSQRIIHQNIVSTDNREKKIMIMDLDEI